MDASQMTAKLEYVPIDRLEHYVGKKVCAMKCMCDLASGELILVSCCQTGARCSKTSLRLFTLPNHD